MLLNFLIFLFSWSALEAAETSGSCEIISLYHELNCNPVFEENSPCPVAYDCDHSMLKNGSVNCTYRGKIYNKGQEITDEDNKDICKFNCRCIARNGNLSWICASGECFGDVYEPGCVNQYKTINSCCREKIYCEKTDKKPIHKCVHEDKTYVEGQQIYNEKECKKCLCDRSFNGSFDGPSCQHQSCGLALDSISYIRDGCVPVYYAKSHCSCPIEYKCPSAADKIDASSKQLAVKAKSKRKCNFGNLLLDVGEKLAKEKTDPTECSCSTPPYLTCIARRNE